MAGGEIALHQRELLFRAPWPAGGDLKIGIALQQPPLRRIRLKGIGDYANGHAGVAIVAAWTIGDVLAAAKADAAERLVELSRARTPQFGEYLTLCLARDRKSTRLNSS